MAKTHGQLETFRRWYNFHLHPCVDCGQPCDYRAKRCKHCSGIERWKTHPLPKGKDSTLWQGGIRHSGGYIFIKDREHPRADGAGYVAEHILVWEQTHNKPLPKGWCVHHLNGITDDNRPKNLKGLPNKKHSLVLQAKAKRIQELEALLNSQHQLL